MFKDRTVIITGGSSGLGKELAGLLLKRGARVAILARDREKLAAAASELSSKPDAPMTYSCDVTDFASVEEAFKAVAERLGPLDILINSAGVLREGYFETIPLEVFRLVMDINYMGTVNCARAALPYFEGRGGRIVNICSSGGLIGAFGYAAYCSSKFAVHGLSEVLRSELKPRGIRVHVVCPGEFESPMVDELEASNRTPENRAIVHTIPVLDAARVARETVAGLEKGRYLIIPGRVTRLLEMMNRWFPALARRIVDYRLKKAYRGPGI